jgi:hypothetical protein
MYYRHDHEANKVLKTPKIYKKSFQRSFVKEQQLKFSQLLENTRQVSFKYANKICFDLSKILENKNSKIKIKKLTKFKTRLKSNYFNKIKKIKINYFYVKGCDKYASSYIKSLLDMDEDTYNTESIEKKHYTRCVANYERKLKRLKRLERLKK